MTGHPHGPLPDRNHEDRLLGAADDFVRNAPELRPDLRVRASRSDHHQVAAEPVGELDESLACYPGDCGEKKSSHRLHASLAIADAFMMHVQVLPGRRRRLRRDPDRGRHPSS
jgi:hypothetical protein